MFKEETWLNSAFKQHLTSGKLLCFLMLDILLFHLAALANHREWCALIGGYDELLSIDVDHFDGIGLQEALDCMTSVCDCSAVVASATYI